MGLIFGKAVNPLSPDLTSGVWLETPDVLAFSLTDAPVTKGNAVQLASADTANYDTSVQRTNTGKTGSTTEWCRVVGYDKKTLVFDDLPPASFIDRLAVRDYTKYSITGGAGLTVTKVYEPKQESIDEGVYTHDNSNGVQLKITVFLQLSSRPVEGTTYTISHSDGAFDDLTFTYSARSTRFGALRSSFGGHRPSDPLKYAYLTSKLYGGDNFGAVDFVNDYGITEVLLVDLSGNIKKTVTPSLRVSSTDKEPTGDAYAANGIDCVDLSQSWTVTALTRGTTTTVTAPGHPFVGGEKARFRGMAGTTGLENIGQASNGTSWWVAATVSNVDGDNFDINIDTSSMSDLSTSTFYRTDLGGYQNQVYQCFNTNRAATHVWGIDYSDYAPVSDEDLWLYVPGVGIGDKIEIKDDAHKINAALHHAGVYNLRLGMAISKGNYTRGITLRDGHNGLQNYQSNLPALWASETNSAFGTKAASGSGAYLVTVNSNTPFGTTTRAVDSHGGHQDAADNDDILYDHAPYISQLAWVFETLPLNGRDAGLEVDLSTDVLNATLYAGTDSCPPVFHELAWYLDAYLSQQNKTSGDPMYGSVPGGYGIGHFSQQTPNFPEPLDIYRGTDPNNGTPQSGDYTVGAFLYAPDHLSGMILARAFAKFSIICDQYGLSDLRDTYKQAALDLYAWSNGIWQATCVPNWAPSTAYTPNGSPPLTYVRNGGNIYLCKTAGTSASSGGPTGTSADITDGTARWTYIEPSVQDYDIDYYYNASLGLKSNMGWSDATWATNIASTINTFINTKIATAVTMWRATGDSTLYAPLFNANYVQNAAGAGEPAWDYSKLSSDVAYDATKAAYITGRWHLTFSDTLLAGCISENSSFMTMVEGNVGGPNFDIRCLSRHMSDVVNDNSPASSDSLKAMLAQMAFQYGANPRGEAWAIGHGPRHSVNMDYWDTFCRRISPPYGITRYMYAPQGFGYTGIVGSPGSMKSGTNCDGPLNFLSENTTGEFEASPTFGSKKVWEPWRMGMGYYDFTAQGSTLISMSEFDLGKEIANLCAAMWLHGWDRV